MIYLFQLVYLCSSLWRLSTLQVQQQYLYKAPFIYKLYFKMQENNEQPQKKPRKKSSTKRTESSHEHPPSRQKKLVGQKTQQKKLKKQKNLKKNLSLKVGKYEIDVECVLGKGTFGHVYRAKLIERPDQVFACKLISKTRLERSKMYEDDVNQVKSLIERLQAEVAAQKKFSDCKHIVKLFDYVKQEDGYYIFMELCEIDLGKFIRENGALSEAEAMDYFKQLLKGYKCLFDQNISHRDLKPQNLLLQDNTLKISDFGFVKVHSSGDITLRSAQKNLCLAQSFVGSINYISPDIMIAEKQKKLYDAFKSDMWSMGIILYKMIYGKEPYVAAITSQLLEKILTQPLTFPEEPKISHHTRTLMIRLIEKDPNLRPSFKQIYAEEVGEDTEIKEESKGPSYAISLQKQHLLVFYNLLITKISYDSAHHATLREIGIPEYQRYSYRLMTLLHEKRQQLQKSSKDINPELRKQVQSYEKIFYQAIKQSSEMHEANTDLTTELKEFHHRLKMYSEYDMLHKEIQYFLLLLLLLYNHERGFVSTDYVFTIVEKEKNNKMNLKKLEELTKKNLDYK